MDLPAPLLKRCYATLLKCIEFDSLESLEAVFATNELDVYKGGLPKSSNKRDRVIETTHYLLWARSSSNESVLPLFILALRDRRHDVRDALRVELDELHLDVKRALSGGTPAASGAPFTPAAVRDPDSIDTWSQTTPQRAEASSSFEQAEAFWEQPVEQAVEEPDTPVTRIRRNVAQWWDELGFGEIAARVIQRWNEQDRRELATQVVQWWNEQDRRTTIIAVVIPAVLLCILCVLTVIRLSGWTDRAATVSPTPAAAPTTAPTLPPPPTATSIPTPTLAPPTPTATSIPTTTRPAADSPDDVVYYDVADVNQLVENPPAVIDIRSAGVAADMRVNLQPAAEEMPPELAGCAVAEGEALLWIELYEPITSVTQGEFYWLYVLDMDGDVNTGRPSGTTAINPDLGYEAAVYVEYSNGEFSSYFLVWDTANAGFSGLITEGMRHCVDESGTLVGMVPSLDVLSQNAEEFAQVTPNLDAVKGRAAAETYIDGVRRVIDFYPNPPGQFE
jgi:hypothetical protein